MKTGRKPRVSLILRESVMGGVQQSILALTESALAEKFEFAIVKQDEARRQLARGEADVFVFQDACAWRHLPELAAFRLRKGRAKIVIHELHYSDGFERYRVPSPARFRAMLRLCYGLADRVVMISRGQAQWAREHRLLAPGKLSLIVLASRLQPLLAVPPREPSHPLELAAFGRFAPQKGFDVLLAAMRRVPRGAVRLRIAGAGPDEAMLAELARGQEGIEFVGSKSDIAGFLAECDAVVIPSRWEPLGLVCMEAKAAGKPVIVSRIDGLTEQAAECGILVEPEDEAALAAAIAQIAELPPETLRAWGATGREEVRAAMPEYLAGWDALLSNLTADAAA